MRLAFPLLVEFCWQQSFRQAYTLLPIHLIFFNEVSKLLCKTNSRVNNTSFILRVKESDVKVWKLSRSYIKNIEIFACTPVKDTTLPSQRLKRSKWNVFVTNKKERFCFACLPSFLKRHFDITLLVLTSKFCLI